MFLKPRHRGRTTLLLVERVERDIGAHVGARRVDRGSGDGFS